MPSLANPCRREIIHIGTGQCGVQAQKVFWEMACKEHFILPSGLTNRASERTSLGHTILFEESSDDRFFPRTLFIDAEPACIDAVLTSRYKKLFDEKDFICGNQSSASNYAIGRNTTWKNLYEAFDESFSTKYESCDSLNSLISFHSICGGTGSGTSSAINFALDAVLNKVTRMNATIYPSQVFSSSTLEQYNAGLALKDDSNQIDFYMMYDNLGLYRMYCNAEYDDVNYRHLNDLLSQSASDLTSCDRFHGLTGFSAEQLKTNLCPFPLLKYITPGMHQMRASIKSAPKISRVTYDVMKSTSGLNGYDHLNGVNSAVVLLYRGDMSPRTVTDSISKARKKLEFFSWSGNGIKFGVCPRIQESMDFAVLDRTEVSCSRFSNNTVAQTCFAMIQKRFSNLLQFHAFIHWFTREPGFEEFEFNDTVEFLENLRDNYKDMGLLETNFEATTQHPMDEE